MKANKKSIKHIPLDFNIYNWVEFEMSLAAKIRKAVITIIPDRVVYGGQ